MMLVDKADEAIRDGIWSEESRDQEMEKDPVLKNTLCDAYTAGVNAYIDELTTANLPLEYKLLGYQPEKWNNLKTALFLKYMSLDLSGSENDFEFSNARAVFDAVAFDKLYPITQDSLDPIVPKGTIFDTPAVRVHIPAMADSLYNASTTSIARTKPNRDNGSNNWAVSGIKNFKSGRPILCNDPTSV